MRPDPEQLVPTIEAVLFAADQPVTVASLAELLGGLDPADVRRALDVIRAGCETPERGVQLVDIAGGYQLLTKSDHAGWVDLFLRGRRKVRLTRSALEALAIVAYKQPVTKVEIDEIRGVDSSGVLATLLERNLVEIAGRAAGVGRPLLYSTTQEFLGYFGLVSLEELPKLSELTQLLEAAGPRAEIEIEPEEDAPRPEAEAPEGDRGEDAPIEAR